MLVTEIAMIVVYTASAIMIPLMAIQADRDAKRKS